MKKVQIGNTNLTIVPVNLGGNVFGWTLTEKESFALLDSFRDKGFNFIDTADMYSYWVDGKGGGQSETILGNWMKSRNCRKDIIMATKVGGATGLHAVDTSKKHILEAVDKSLRRLQTDYIDLYYTHFDDEKTPVEETLDAYQEIIKAGKVRSIGASNLSPERLKASLDASSKYNLPKYEALQPLYNLVERKNYENNYAPIAADNGLSVFPYFSLASGFLTGKYRSESDFSKSPRGEGVKKYMNDKGLDVLKKLDQLAEKHNTVPATIALAWLLAQPNVTASLASATNEQQLETLLHSIAIHLDAEDLALFE